MVGVPFASFFGVSDWGLGGQFAFSLVLLRFGFWLASFHVLCGFAGSRAFCVVFGRVWMEIGGWLAFEMLLLDFGIRIGVWVLVGLH